MRYAKAMLSLPQVDAAASDVAAATLSPGALVRPQTHVYDGTDEDQLWVLFVVHDSAFADITGRHAMELGEKLQRRLQADGEDRFAVIAFAGEEELAADGGT